MDTLLQILQSVDMSDSNQANTAISIVNTLVSGPAGSPIPTGNVYQVSKSEICRDNLFVKWSAHTVQTYAITS